MSDRYANFAATGAGRALVKRLGLPDPPRLRRYHPGARDLAGAVLLGGDGRLVEPIARVLANLDADVRRPTVTAPGAAETAVPAMATAHGAAETAVPAMAAAPASAETAVPAMAEVPSPHEPGVGHATAIAGTDAAAPTGTVDLTEPALSGRFGALIFDATGVTSPTKLQDAVRVLPPVRPIARCVRAGHRVRHATGHGDHGGRDDRAAGPGRVHPVGRQGVRSRHHGSARVRRAGRRAADRIDPAIPALRQVRVRLGPGHPHRGGRQAGHRSGNLELGSPARRQGRPGHRRRPGHRSLDRRRSCRATAPSWCASTSRPPATRLSQVANDVGGTAFQLDLDRRRRPGAACVDSSASATAASTSSSTTPASRATRRWRTCPTRRWSTRSSR